MSEIATIPDREIVNTVDVLFNLAAQYDPPVRARALEQLAGQIAASKIENESDSDSPWAIQSDDNEEERARKEFLLYMETQRRTLKEIRELALVAQQAEILAGMRFSKVDGYVDPTGVYITIWEAYASTRPDPESYASSGRARSIEAFVITATKTLLEFGIPEERIIAMNRPGMRSSLADYNAWIGRITRMPLDRQQTTEALEHLVDTALTCHSGRDFRDQMKVRYEETGEDLGKGMYTTEKAGDTVHVAVEAPADLWYLVVEPRIRDVVKPAPIGSLFPAISPAQIERVLGLERKWNPEEQQLMRAVIMASPPRQICLDIMEAWANEETTVKSIQRVVNLTSYQIRAAMIELCTYHWDGITTFCRLSRVEGDEQYWVLNTENEV